MTLIRQICDGLFTLCAQKYHIKHPRNFIIGHLHINSIQKKFYAVECILNEGLLCLQFQNLNWMILSLCHSLVWLTFQLTEKTEIVMLYVRCNIPHRGRTDLEPEPINYHGTELMIIEAQLYQTEIWFIIVIYKPLKVNDKHFEIVFSDSCQTLQRESSHWFIMGDTNFDIWVLAMYCVTLVFCIIYLI